MAPETALKPPEVVAPVATTIAPTEAETLPIETVDATEVNWGDIATDNEIPEEELAPASSIDVDAVVPVKATPGAAVAPPVVPPAQKPVSAQTVVPAPSPTPQVTSTPEPVAPVVTPAPVAAPVDYAKLRDEYLTEVEQSYAMTEDEGVELLRAPEKVLPKLAAQVQVNIAEQVIQHIVSMLPQFIDGHVGQQKVSTENRKDFFDAWPDLNKPEYQDTLTRVALTYRHQNPAAPKERAIKEIGAIAAVALGVVPQGNTQAPPSAPPAPPAFRPILPGGGGAPTVAPSDNPFTALAESWGKDD
jgi:hypothetical protein